VPDLLASYPQLAEQASRLGTRSLLRLPLATRERIVGLVVVGFAEPQPPAQPARWRWPAARRPGCR